VELDEPKSAALAGSKVVKAAKLIIFGGGV
jgi:hypothetical protein